MARWSVIGTSRGPDRKRDTPLDTIGVDPLPAVAAREPFREFVSNLISGRTDDGVGIEQLRVTGKQHDEVKLPL
jgi:hypothetical protein